MMKKLLTACTAMLLCVCLLSTGAFAFTFTELDSGEVFDPEIIARETVSDWARDGVVAAQETWLIPALTGSPGYRDAITREQFAELVVQTVAAICGEPDAVPADTFTDTNNPAILRACRAGIVTGVGGGRFAPAQATNREQIAVMIRQAIVYIKAETGVDLAPAAADISRFSDKGEVSAWAVDGMGTLVANRIMGGSSATTLSPKSPCTVEQSILLLHQVYEAYQQAA